MRIFSTIGKTIKFIYNLLFILLLIFAVLFIFLQWRGKAVPKQTILEVDLERNYAEYLPRDRWGRLFAREKPVLRDTVEAILRASIDKKVRMLIARVGVSGMSLGKTQEIRNAVLTFRKSGKKAIAFAESFGEFGPGNNAYYLATAFDEIYLQPSGNIGLTGLSMKTPFARRFLEKIGVAPRLAHRKEYKTAAYTFTQRRYTAPHLEADRALLNSMASQIIRGIAEERSLDPEKVDSLINEGPFNAKDALAAKLIDGIAYRDQVYETAEKEAGEKASFLYLSEYLKRAKSPFKGRKKIAVIYGVGPVVKGKSRYSPLGGHIMGSDTVSSAFRAAVRDSSVKAIIFRINSPGGSYVASDTIRRETVKARQAGKPVIVTMSDVAASGGYFVAMAADKIIAHPGTITGSIGVVSGKMVTSELWRKIGIQWGEIFTHENADMWSTTENYTRKQWQYLETWLDEIYNDFLKKVAEGRNMDMESVRKAAKGRVWSGKDAKELGLVDELGGFQVAVREAKAAAGISPEESVGLKVFPPIPSFWRSLFPGGSKNSLEADALPEDFGGILEPWMAKIRDVERYRPYGVLQMEAREIE